MIMELEHDMFNIFMNIAAALCKHLEIKSWRKLFLDSRLQLVLAKK